MKFLLLTSLVLFCYFIIHAIRLIIRRIKTIVEVKKIPGPPMTIFSFFFGHFTEKFGGIRSNNDMLMRWKEIYGDTFRAFPVLWDDATVYIVFSNKGDNPFHSATHEHDRPANFVTKFFPKTTGGSFVTSKIWANHRHLVSKLFKKSYLRKYFNIIQDLTIKVQDKMISLKGNGADSIKAELWCHRYSLDVVGQVLFAYDFNAIDLMEKNEHEHFNQRKHRMFAAFSVLGPTLAKFLMYRLWPEGLEYYAKLCTAFNKTNRDSATKTLLEAGMPADELEEEMHTLVEAGHETTAKNITWTLYLLAKHPEVQKQYKEMFKDFETTYDNICDHKELKKLQYECIRLKPLFPRITRKVGKTTKYGDYTIPKGSYAYIQKVLPDDEEFNPLKYEKYTDINDIANPFGKGKRKCVGYKLAELEFCTFFAHFFKNYSVTLDEGKPPLTKTWQYVVIAPHNVHVHIMKDSL